MSEVPYTNLAGKIKEYFDKFQEAGIPDKVTYKWLASVGFRSSNDRLIVRVLNAMNFIDDVAIKCDLCGGKPSCVEFCQAEALTYGVPNDISDAKRIALSDKLLEIYRDRLSLQRV